MRIAQGHVDFLAFDFRAITDAIDIQHAGKPLANPLCHVRDQLTREPVQRAALSILRPALDAHDVTLDVHIDTRRHGRVQFSFRSLHVNCIGVHCDLDARRDGYRQLSDT